MIIIKQKLKTKVPSYIHTILYSYHTHNNAKIPTIIASVIAPK